MLSDQFKLVASFLTTAMLHPAEGAKGEGANTIVIIIIIIIIILILIIITHALRGISNPRGRSIRSIRRIRSIPII